MTSEMENWVSGMRELIFLAKVELKEAKKVESLIGTESIYKLEAEFNILSEIIMEIEEKEKNKKINLQRRIKVNI